MLKFSSHVITAAKNPIPLDEKQANAVAARIELDLRLGAAFTRMQTLALKPMIDSVQELKVISYGSCQFPTLGFVVSRYFRVKNFVPETFWYIRVTHQKENINVNFNWNRGHLFDRMAVTILFERCLMAKTAKVIIMQKKPTSKWKPLPLTTVELQRMGSLFLRMDSQRVMKVGKTWAFKCRHGLTGRRLQKTYIRRDGLAIRAQRPTNSIKVWISKSSLRNSSKTEHGVHLPKGTYKFI
jgi:DNA topoisomerase-3